MDTDIEGSEEQKLLLCLLERVDRLSDELSSTLANLKLTIANAPNNSIEAKVAVWMHSVDDRDMRFTDTRQEMLTTKQKKKIIRKGYYLYEVRPRDNNHVKNTDKEYLLSRHNDRFSDSSYFEYRLVYL